MRSVRRPDEWHDLLARARADRKKRVIDGKSELADRSQILLPDRQSAELAAARKVNPNAINALPFEYIDQTLQFRPDKIAPRPILFMTVWCRPRESQALFDKAGEPKSLIVLRGFGRLSTASNILLV
jgi:hypothetical protein